MPADKKIKMSEDHSKKSVVVCDTQPITAQGLRSLLASAGDLEFLASLNSLDAATQLLARKPPDIVIVDKGFGMRAVLDWIHDLRLTDATPAVEGSYVAYRQARLEIARQYRENPMLGGRPAFDVILGGGADPFTGAGRVDKRDLISEFRGMGYRYVANATDLRGVNVAVLWTSRSPR